MARDLDHLELPRITAPLPRRLHGGGRAPKRDSKQEHGQHLIEETEEVLSEYVGMSRLVGISPALVFRLKMHPGADIDEDQLHRMGLNVISKDADKTVVVFSSDEALQEFKQYLKEYAGRVPDGHEYTFIAAIDDIVPLRPEDRRGRLLREEPLEGDGMFPLDVELMHPGDKESCRRYIAELRTLAEACGGGLTDSYIGDHLCLARCHLGQEALDSFLRVEYIMEIDRKPRPTFDTSLVFQTTLDDVGEVPEVPEDATGVLVVDSGVMGNHPLLRPTLGEAAVFPDKMRERIQGGPEDGDAGGHGTAVCGIAAYGDVGQCLETRVFRQGVRIFSARVLDDNCEYDVDELVEHQIADAVQYFVTTYPQCRVINISLGDDRLFTREGQKQFRLSAKIDELAYELRDLNILFVISAGNFNFVPENPEERRTGYPDYLLQDEARVCDPGTASLALTVGSLSTGNAPYQYNHDASRRCIAGQRGFPSPFTRTGFGVDGMVKPELVEFGGDELFDRTGSGRDPGVGIPTTAKDFAPPNGRLFRCVLGTSFAAPAVSNLAARLFDRFPGATSNLIRALIADSARVPSDRPSPLDGEPWTDGVLRVYGYGQPSFERAAFSDQGEVLLVADTEIPLDNFHLYEVPALPDEFFEQDGERFLSVTLVHDPPTRHTRGDSYQGVTMEFNLFRNMPVTAVEALYRDWKHAPAGDNETVLEERISALPSAQRVSLHPGTNRRKKGTLQKGTIRIASRRWQYDGGALLLAVASLRKWAPADIDSQRYAVVVSLRHTGEGVRLYERIRQRARVAQRIRVKA